MKHVSVCMWGWCGWGNIKHVSVCVCVWGGWCMCVLGDLYLYNNYMKSILGPMMLTENVILCTYQL